MKANSNNTNKTIRILLFFILLSMYVSGIIPDVWRFILLGFARVLMTTVLLGSCIIYHLTNISTKTEPRHKINEMIHAATAGSNMTGTIQSDAFVDRWMYMKEEPETRIIIPTASAVLARRMISMG